MNGSGDFLAALDTEINVTVADAEDNAGLEPSLLTNTTLLLNGHDFHDLVLEVGFNEGIDDFDVSLLREKFYNDR